MTDSVSNTDLPEPTDEMDPEATREETAPEAETPTADGPSLEEVMRELEDELGLEDDVAISELVALREEFESLNDRHLRLAAEFNNYRRRVEQERADTWARAQADIVARFLDVLDDLQRVAALDLGNATVEAIMEGIDLVDRKFVRMLAEAGAEVLDPQGERFNPETMEAMMRVPAESEEDDETVAQVFQKGYTLRGQLVRPARVSVLKLD